VGYKRPQHKRDTDINKLTVSNIVSEIEAYQGNGFDRGKGSNGEDFATQPLRPSFI
jgi:hypothetical protein